MKWKSFDPLISSLIIWPIFHILDGGICSSWLLYWQTSNFTMFCINAKNTLVLPLIYPLTAAKATDCNIILRLSTHTRRSVPCPDTSDPQSPVGLTGVSADGAKVFQRSLCDSCVNYFTNMRGQHVTASKTVPIKSQNEIIMCVFQACVCGVCERKTGVREELSEINWNILGPGSLSTVWVQACREMGTAVLGYDTRRPWAHI